MIRKDVKPIEEGNAKYINEVCSPIKFAMFQYEQIASYYTKEPLYVRLRLNEDEKVTTYEQILRFRYIIPSDRINSWMVYSVDREWPFKNSKQCGLIIRNVIWDRKHDTNLIKDNQNIKEQKRWPTVYIKNIYLRSDNIDELIKKIKEIDQLVKSGIMLKKRRSNDHPLWLDIEIMRWYDWGQVMTTWSPYEMMNNEIEMEVIKLNDLLEEYKNYEHEKIYQMDLDYLIPTEVFKKYTQGY